MQDRTPVPVPVRHVSLIEKLGICSPSSRRLRESCVRTLRSISKGRGGFNLLSEVAANQTHPEECEGSRDPEAPSSRANWKHAAHLLAAIMKGRRGGCVNKCKDSQGHSRINNDSWRCSPFVPLTGYRHGSAGLLCGEPPVNNTFSEAASASPVTCGRALRRTGQLHIP